MRNILIKWAEGLINRLERIVYLDKYDLVERGWKVVDEDKRYTNFSKGKYTIKLENKRMIVSLRYNKAPRFFGVIETAKEFDRAMELINKYYKK